MIYMDPTATSQSDSLLVGRPSLLFSTCGTIRRNLFRTSIRRNFCKIIPIALKFYTEMLNIYGMLVQNLQCLGLKDHYNRCIISEITAIASYGQIPSKSALCVIYTFVLAMV